MSKKDTSALIGEKLLQGWTMLADMCPNASMPGCTGVPLMKERGTQRMLCVNCGIFYVKVQDPKNQSSYIIVPETQVRAATKQEVKTGKAQSEAEKKKAEVKEKEEETLAATSSDSDSESSDTSPKVNNHKQRRERCRRRVKDDSHDADIQHTVTVLYKKMAEATKKMEESTDPHTISELCSEIIQITRTIKVVTSLL